MGADAVALRSSATRDRSAGAGRGRSQPWPGDLLVARDSERAVMWGLGSTAHLADMAWAREGGGDHSSWRNPGHSARAEADRVLEQDHLWWCRF